MASNNGTDTTINPNADLKAPKWINEDLFQEILKSDIPKYLKIKSFKPVAAIASGENYLSSLFRIFIEVQLTDQSIIHTSYILKTNVESETTQDFVEQLNAFPKEKEMYEEVLPRFEKLYAEVGKTIKFAPSCKYVQDNSNNIAMIMEDLRSQNFLNIDREKGLDMPHMISVLKKLADFHAASAVYTERFGTFSESLSNSIFTEKYRDMFKTLGAGKDKMFKNALPKWGDCEKYIPLWPNPDKLFDWFIKATTADPNEFNVLNHGDCWLNNCMFQHNKEGDITETYFVDFQVTVYGTPAEDLHYFITSSAQFDLRIEEFDNFIKIYHEHLSENLKLLKYKKSIPSLKDIQNMTMKYSFWSFLNATTVLPAVLAVGEGGNFEKLTGEDNERMIMNPKYVKVIKHLLPWWESRGIFEF